MGAGGRAAALLLSLLLLCGCSRVQVPAEELQAAGRPVDGVPAEPQQPEVPKPQQPESKPVLEESLCALLPDGADHCVLYDCWGQPLAVLPLDATMAGVYRADAILGGYRLSDGSPVLPQTGRDALWLQDTAGFTVYDTAAGMLHRLDAAGMLLFTVAVPQDTAQVSLLPLGRGYVCSLWRGSGTAAEPWEMTAPCVVLDDGGRVTQDLSAWIAAPVTGVLGEDVLLLAGKTAGQADAYGRDGTCLGEGLLPVPDESQPEMLGGRVCRLAWKEGWLYSADLQPLQACAHPEGLVACGEYISGTVADIDGIAGNGELLVFDGGAAFWGVEGNTLAVQWQGINYHFPAGKRQFQRLQLCSKEMAVVWAWDADGSGSFRLLYFATGMVLEYDCPADVQCSALLGQGYALLAQVNEAGACRLQVVDADGRLCCTDTRPMLPCAAGPYLLCRDGGESIIVGVDGTPLSIGQNR